MLNLVSTLAVSNQNIKASEQARCLISVEYNYYMQRAASMDLPTGAFIYLSDDRS